jgi:hypothetical protein
VNGSLNFTNGIFTERIVAENGTTVELDPVFGFACIPISLVT